MAKHVFTDEDFTPYLERSVCVVVWAGNAVRFWEWAGDVQHWVSGHGHGKFHWDTVFEREPVENPRSGLVYRFTDHRLAVAFKMRWG